MNLYESIVKESIITEPVEETKEVKETEKLVESTKKVIKTGLRNDEPVALINWEGNYQPYVLAINYNEDTGSWGYGYYYSDEDTANKAFDWVCSGGNMHDFDPNKKVEIEVHTSESEDTIEECNSSSIKKEGEYEDIYGEEADYTEMRADIMALRSICDKAEADGFNFVDKFKKAINDLSDVCSDIEEFYEGQQTSE